MTATVLLVAIGMVVGVVLGALGGGGTVLAVPALTYLAGVPAHQAVTVSLVAVGVGAAVNTVAAQRERHVDFSLVATFGVLGVGGSYLGTALNHRVPERVLLASFAVVLAVAAALLLRRMARRDCPVTPRARDSRRARVSVAVAAIGVGFLTGFLGVGGGFVVVPVLIVALDVPVDIAAGTSLAVIAINSLVAIVARVHTGLDLPVETAMLFTVATVAMSFVGRAAARAMSPATATAVLAAVLSLVAGGVGVQVLVGG